MIHHIGSAIFTLCLCCCVSAIHHERTEVSCGFPPFTPRSNYDLTGMNPGDQVNYKCDEGYNLEGMEVLTCDSNGKWGTGPCCRKETSTITPTDVDWCCSNLTDTALANRLEDLSEFVGILTLSSNNLTHIQGLTNYTQLDTLKELWLLFNKIGSFLWEQIPANVEQLGLSFNELTSLPVMSDEHRCLQVRMLRLDGNKIQTIENNNFPATLTELRIGGNQLTTVGDLSLLPLSLLLLEFNPITDIRAQNLPMSLNKLLLSGNKFTQVPDLSQLQITRLSLSYSKLSELNGQHLPISLTGLYLYGKRIRQVSDMSHLVNLRVVYVSRGKIKYYRKMFPQAQVKLY